MPRPQFADMLVNRRRQLGLSITQASQVLRLKEQVLVAFEEGDFERIPKSGYAQGMLSSYARYLGLNSRDVVRQFSRDLDRYLEENPGIDQMAESYGGGTGDVTRRQVATFGTAPYVGSRGLLPTSGGPAGDMGAFATTSQPHSRLQSSAYGQGDYGDADQGGYGSQGSYGSQDPYGDQQRRYTSRQPSSAGSAYAASRSLTRYGDARYADDGRTAAAGYGRDQVRTRRVSPSQYTDDLRYENDAYPYEAASTREGRRSSRNIANAERPRGADARVRQRTQSRQRARSGPARGGQGGRSGGQGGGIVGSVVAFFSDGRNALIAIAAVLALALTIIIILSVQSCVANRSGATSDARTVAVSQADSSSSTDLSAQTTSATATSATGATGTAAGTSSADASAATSALAEVSSSKKTAKETKVVVSVETGMVSWVDIQLDGESMVADTITGPWSETYDVHESITVNVGDTTAVTVTENGSRKQFDTKTSGIGSITIQGTPEQTSTSKTDSTDASGKTDDETSTDGDESSKSDSKKTDDESKKSDSDKKKTDGPDLDTSVDEYLYEFNGYDIYYNEGSDLYYFIDEDGVAHNANDGSVL